MPEPTDGINTRFGKSVWLKMCFAFKIFYFDIIQMLGNISFQNALKCKHLKMEVEDFPVTTFDPNHLPSSPHPPPPFGFSYSSAKS